MTSPSKGTFGDPSVAMAFRDLISSMTRKIVDKMRPEPQYGVVLNVYKGGAEFRIGDSSVPDGPAPAGPGNPRQVYYATVKLDTGEEVPARVHENIPVARSAAIYDAAINEGSSVPYLISNDAYHRRIVVERTDESGQVYNSVEPESAHMSAPPLVPPRVMIEGHAGKYVLTRIVRGMTRMENPVLESPLVVSASQYYNHILDAAGTTELRTISQEYTTQYSGFVGSCGWKAQGTYEVTIRYGNGYSRHVFSMMDITSSEWERWFLIPASEEVSNIKDAGFATENTYHVLFGYVSATGSLFLFVCNRLLDSYVLDVNRFTGGSVTLKSINKELVAQPEAVMPAQPLPNGTSAVWGLSRQQPTIELVSEYASFAAGSSSFRASLLHLQRSLTGGGAPRVTDVSASRYLQWNQRFIVMTAKAPWMPSGYFDINMPPVGTQITVVGGNAIDAGPLPTRPVTTDGIDITGWCGLYYVLPFDTSATRPENFVIVNYTGYFEIPDHWILIARTNTDTMASPVVLGNGQSVPVLKTLAVPNIANLVLNSGGYPARYCKVSGLVVWSGALTATAAIAAGAISTNAPVPEGYRPGPALRCVGDGLYLPSGGTPTSVRFDILRDGNISIQQAMAANSSVFLDNISYAPWA